MCSCLFSFFIVCVGSIALVACMQIRVSFVNEFGVEEAGIDGGGIFKDFMENITRAAFDVQYGLFKVIMTFFIISMVCYYCGNLGQYKSL